jgi:hypothetical protein
MSGKLVNPKLVENQLALHLHSSNPSNRTRKYLVNNIRSILLKQAMEAKQQTQSNKPKTRRATRKNRKNRKNRTRRI